MSADVTTIFPSGGSDDWPAVYAALVANAYLRPVQMAAGTWRCASFAGSNSINIPNGTVLIGSPGVVIESTLTPTSGGGQTVAVFGHVALPPSGATDTTVAAQSNPGDETLTLTSLAIGGGGANVAVGNTIVIGETNRYFYYEVLAVNTGTKVVTIDRPMVTTFAAGVIVGVRTDTRDIRILGNGMRIRGTGDRAINLPASFRCQIESVVVEPNDAGQFFSDTPVSYDIGSRFSTFYDLKINNGGLGLNGLSLESCESCTIDDCELRGSATNFAGLYLAASYFCKIIDMRSVNCYLGLWLGSGGGADIYGCRSNSFVNCEFRENTNTGVYIQNGSSFNAFMNCFTTHNGSLGVYVGPGLNSSEPTRENNFVNCVVDGNTLGGFQTIGGTVPSRDTVLINVQCVGGGGFGLDCGGDTTIDGLIARGNSSGGVQVSGSANLSARAITAEQTANGFWPAVLMNTTGTVSIGTLRISTGGTGTKLIFSHTSGLLIASDVKILSGNPTYGYFSAASSAAKLRRGPNVDLSAATTPYSIGAGSLQSFGTATLATGSATVANAMINATDRLMFTRKTQGAGPGHLSYTLTAGTSFTMSSSSATDSGQVDWNF